MIFVVVNVNCTLMFLLLGVYKYIYLSLYFAILPVYQISLVSDNFVREIFF